MTFLPFYKGSFKNDVDTKLCTLFLTTIYAPTVPGLVNIQLCRLESAPLLNKYILLKLGYFEWRLSALKV